MPTVKIHIGLLIVLLFPSLLYASDPVIFPVASAPCVTGAYIAWTTDQNSTSVVNYGTTISYGSTTAGPIFVNTHHVTLSGLTANTTYHYKVTSGSSSSTDMTFSTYANPTGTVKKVGPTNGCGGACDYSTIQACASAASQGWTCLIYSGTYSEHVTPSSSGSAGNYITFLAQEPAIVDSFNLDNKTYIAIKGLNINSASYDAIHGYGADYMLIENNYIHPQGGQPVRTTDGNEANYAIVRGNIVDMENNQNHNPLGIYAFGDGVLVENNDFTRGTDCIHFGSGTYGHGVQNVIRNNVCHHLNHDLVYGSEHIDGIQLTGSVYAGQTLIENNVEYSCLDSTGNCHFIYARAPALAGTSVDTVIIRYNYAHQIQNTCIGIGSHEDLSLLTNWMTYNNTCATEALPAETGMCITYDTGTGSAKNNICYQSSANDWSPTYGGTGNSNNIAFNTGYSGNWASPYSSETTFSSLKNRNPTFTNYPYSSSIVYSSPAVDTGGSLTSVTSGCGTNTLVLGNSHFFQPGWAGTNADTLSIGTVSNTALISSITYLTNIVVFTNTVSCTNGDNVWLHKKSDGVVVLYGNAPDVGAYEWFPTNYSGNGGLF